MFGMAELEKKCLKNPKKKEKYELILKYVAAFRKKNDITPTPGRKKEGSCYHQGEFNNLMYAQLIHTPYGDGCWTQLEDKEVFQGIFKLAKEHIAEVKEFVPKTQDELEKAFHYTLGLYG
jgi:hypothetical protein